MRTATVRAARMLSPSVRELTLDPGAGFTFQPGQWVSLHVPQPGGGTRARDYSIASPPRRDGRFELAITRVGAGGGSQALHRVQPGDVLPLSTARGSFGLGSFTRPVLMVATGTGIAPLRSILLARGRDLSHPPVTLLHGVRDEQEQLYREDFERLVTQWAPFRYEPTLSRPSASWRGRRGYVQEHVLALVDALGGDCEVLLSGLRAMIDSVSAQLTEQVGLPRARIYTEQFD
jgi:ferredoxin-NADP reductase